MRSQPLQAMLRIFHSLLVQCLIYPLPPSPASPPWRCASVSSSPQQHHRALPSATRKCRAAVPVRPARARRASHNLALRRLLNIPPCPTRPCVSNCSQLTHRYRPRSSACDWWQCEPMYRKSRFVVAEGHIPVLRYVARYLRRQALDADVRGGRAHSRLMT